MFERERLFKFHVCFCRKKCDPSGGTCFDPIILILTVFVEVYKAMLRSKYLSSSACSFTEEDFLSFPHVNL